MSYKITLRVYQTNTNAYFRIAEQTVWQYANGGDWSCKDEEHTLSMGGSGTSGTIRFISDTGENFIIAVGVHNYKRWCDIVTNLTGEQTGTIINPQYYDPGQSARQTQREKQLATYSVSNNKGRKFSVNYTVAEGNSLKANIVIA